MNNTDTPRNTGIAMHRASPTAEPANIYPPDTIGYHHYHACAVFGDDSRPVKWLEEQAAKSPGGMNEPVVIHETQVLHLLGSMWKKELDAK